MIASVFAVSVAVLLLYDHMVLREHPEPDHRAWPRNRTRDTKVYVQPDKTTTIHAPKNICSGPKPPEKKLPLLIIVNSAPAHFEVRDMIRSSWGNTKHYKPMKSYLKLLTQNNIIDGPQKGNVTTPQEKEFDVIYMVGVSPNKKLKKLLEREIKKYGDILQENFIESYYNLSIKSVLMLKWLTNNCNDSVNYVLKVDDDIFLDLHLIWIYLVQRPILDRMYKIYGFFQCYKTVQRIYSKWYCPKYLFPNDTYPCYFDGSLYLMTLPAAIALYEAALETPLFPYEDIFITGMCRENATPSINGTDEYNFLFKPFLEFVPNNEKMRYGLESSSARQLNLKWRKMLLSFRVNYVLKTDDDVLVNIELILSNIVFRPKTSDMTTYEMFGYLNCITKVRRVPSCHWYCPRYICPDDKYPCFYRGLGYLLTLPTIKVLYETALKTPLIPFEDIYITGYCRENLKPPIDVTDEYNFIFKPQGGELMTKMFQSARNVYVF